MTKVEKLLVPLDGSHLAEAVLPVARRMAERFHATVSLLHVMEQGAPETVHGERHLADVGEADAYLARVAEQCRCQGIAVETHVHPNEERDVVASIIGHSREFGADLILLATHGWGGMRDLLVGSIAQQVLRRGNLPVLLVKPTATGKAPPFEGKRLLVPLVGRPDHDGAVLPVVEAVASPLGSSLLLMMVVPTLATMPRNQGAAAMLTPTATAMALNMEVEEAGAYLERTAGRLRAAGLSASTEVRRGDPASAVVEGAQETGVDLVVMSTHGRAGLDAFWSASVGSKILSRVQQPLLLVKVPE
jgi:nucleotide-binding universal stress UspA family protein